jgi:hypothetical protein
VTTGLGAGEVSTQGGVVEDWGGGAGQPVDQPTSR